MGVSDAEPFKLGDWLVEPKLVRISKSGTVRKLEFRSMQILLCLVTNRGEVVSKKKLHDEVWGEVYVTDNSLTRGISKLRKAFDDDPLEPQYIDTISKSGYRLLAPVEFINNNLDEADIAEPAAVPVLQDKRWLWALVAVFVIVGIGLAGTSSEDVYSEFYDPIPVSTLIGPEVGHAISPDGARMSFSYSEPGAQNSDVYVKLLDDLSQMKFTNLESQQAYGFWSPDGTYMAYASVEDGTCGIYKEPSFGGEKTRIGSCFQAPEDFVWSSDGKTIAFTDVKPGDQSRKIFFLDIDTQVAEEILTPENGSSDRDPAFTPDGVHLVFRRMVGGLGGDIYKMRLSDKSLTRLTFDNSRILGLDIFDRGRQIAFSSNVGGPWALWKVPFTGGLITRFQINDRVPVEPRFSSDGKRMIYKSIRDQVQLWQIEKGEDGYNPPERIASSTRSEMHPSLSVDESKMVFISNRSGNFEIWSNNFKDDSYTKLTALDGSFISMPSWSPDGTEVVFDARIDGDNAIYILDVASKMKRTFVDLEGDQLNARYSRDGKTLYFASNHTGSWQIWKKPVFDDHIEAIQVTANGGYHLQEGLNDGFLYFARSDTSGIWRMEDKSGAEAELFIAGLSKIDWGNWVPVKDGIVYVDNRLNVNLQPYNKEEMPVLLFKPTKPIQLANPTLSVTLDGSKIILAQIEKSEDELMMVDFK